MAFLVTVFEYFATIFTPSFDTNFSICSLIILPCVPIYSIHISSAGIFYCFPSTTLFSLILGPDLPWADEPSPGNLRFSVAQILTVLSLLIPAFSLVFRPLLFSV